MLGDVTKDQLYTDMVNRLSFLSFPFDERLGDIGSVMLRTIDFVLTYSMGLGMR